MARLRITVLKRIDPKLIFGERIPIHPMTGKAHSVCSRFQEGQEFIVEENGEMPAGFCAWAWYNIYKDMSVLKYGGNFPWVQEGEAFTCCTNGIRPVLFKLVRI